MSEATPPKVPRRRLGANGPEVSALGLGCMGMSEFYVGATEAGSLETLERALELGIDFLDTADMYGPYTNEELIGGFLKGRRQSVFLATKFGVVRGPRPQDRGVNGRPEYVTSSCEGSLRRLGVDTIDLYYQHRVDPAVPIEETVGAMSRLVEAGKVRFLGLSEAAAPTLRRAAAVHPITALQSEWSLFTRDADAEILPTCRELGIGFVAYSPLGRGFLTGQFQKAGDVPEGDYRRAAPRFAEENFEKNRSLVAALEALAKEKGLSAAQLALAWLLAQGDDVVPIPGTTKRSRLEENARAVEVELSEAELARIAGAVPATEVAGLRYPVAGMQFVGR
ncbi:MAG: aldo/keto reductase [Acidobacteria bacterium]|nr:aldo/keto reductase [Acidobacteriota bacterium]